MSSSPEDRGIFVTERPTLPPAKCCRCGGQTYDGRRYVDFGVSLELPPVAPPGVVFDQVERGGVAYLCSFCIVEIFKATFPDESAPVAEWESEKADLQQTIELQKDLLEHRSAELEKLKKEFDDYRHNNTVNASSVTISSSSLPDSEAESDVSESNGPEQGTAEPDSESRHKNVPSLADLLKASDGNETSS